MMNKPYFDIIVTCNELNENNIYKYWSNDKKYVIYDSFTKNIYIILLIIVLTINTYLACKSVKDIFNII